MAAYSNYIVDTNPFNLAGPPKWFQRQLWEFDPSLVLIPSRMGFFYRLAQRRPLKLKENIVNDVLKEQADTRMLAAHGLVPITTVMATVQWDNPLIFMELRRRAPWRMGGAQKFTEMVEGQDREEALKQRAAEDDRLSYLAKDSWKFYQKLTGVRSHMWSPTVKESSLPFAKGPATINKAPSIIIPTASYRPQTEASWITPRKR